ncbi:Crp/Fnr family transcriptional regulator [Clostridium tagluense]|uniref:Crp/Fnr family transcriptional regulator n=1 Tax=Clostridium tagluense TaxID=360422 RepID=UPI001C6F3C5A|nr:Crp/Fnr family transcriptional regulator [Clostridium tagluense]MBW9156833.1 Crp/Fnr family transcriptional regulator [Clostridium tagluense]MCB2311506.1 Crp/Fnr family transcriptional regulator [Clostridium tagluense]MCB2316230.1 Crp/Fnr family transcriptional regulator [Clostridium tagluense]MCB2320966.1 Crp/Fnr family transcriptional regulator [Clostridium tagluense]MCB2325983.1 Crp/Fnr family transcriptional regulator [Clostridium tagluense]
MAQITLRQLKDLPLFECVEDKTLDLIRESVIIKKIKKSQILFAEREIINNIYIVLDGKVTMYRLSEKGQKRVIYILNSGEIINEVIFDNSTASINCEGFEDSELISISKADLLKIMKKDFKLTEVILYSMSKKIRRLYRQIKNTVPIKMDKRVAAKLWKLSKDYGVQTEEGVLIDIKISITYLADMLGSSRETISRAVKELEIMDMVKIKHRKFIVNREKLSRYFKGV